MPDPSEANLASQRALRLADALRNADIDARVSVAFGKRVRVELTVSQVAELCQLISTGWVGR